MGLLKSSPSMSKDKKSKHSKCTSDSDCTLTNKEHSVRQPIKITLRSQPSDSEAPTCSETEAPTSSDSETSANPSVLVKKSTRRGKSKRGKSSSVSSKKKVKKIPEKKWENPFSNKMEKGLGPDMMFLADAMKLEINTQTMLSHYDARSIEDFLFMSDNDFKDLCAKAKLMNRTLPPLQIRKVGVLKEWVRKMVDTTSNDSQAPDWAKQPKTTIVPKGWRIQFKRDLPTIKQNLRARSEIRGSNPLASFFLNLRSMFLCGAV